MNMRSQKPFSRRIRLWPALGIILLTGCFSPGDRAKLSQEITDLRRAKESLERSLADRDATITTLGAQVNTLRGFDPNRPTDLFAPVKIEVAKLSGGGNYDDRPGDDGITVYLKPVDRFGDVVKVPGRITVQLLDNAVLATPRLIGVYIFDEPDKLAKAWYGMFGTSHYSLKCPFLPNTQLPLSGTLNVSVEFLDFITGITLTTTAEVRYSRSSP